MQLQNAFTVPAPADDAYRALLDLARVAPCMPGAELTGQDGDEYSGLLRLRVGPITVAYEGTVTITESDAAEGRATLRARGSEIGGQGGASATVVASVRPHDDDRSDVEVVTDLDIRGKAAQFGRGAMAEVTQRVLDQFARNLESTFAAPVNDSSPVAAPAPDAPPPSSRAQVADADLDVLGVVLGPAVRRAAPMIGALIAGVVLGRLWGRRGRTPQAWVAAVPWPVPDGWNPVGPPADTGPRT